jgi:hypothetical protein
MLDLGLLSRELGIIDSLLIQEPRDEIDSLLVSSSEHSRASDISSFLKNEFRHPPLSTRVVEARCRNVKGEFDIELVGRRAVFALGVTTMELVVPGRDLGGEELRLCTTTSNNPPAVRFLEEGRGGVERSGFANANPTGAMPTVLEATSCKG